MVAISGQRPLLSPRAFDHSLPTSTDVMMVEEMKVMVVITTILMKMVAVPLDSGNVDAHN